MGTPENLDWTGIRLLIKTNWNNVNRSRQLVNGRVLVDDDDGWEAVETTDHNRSIDKGKFLWFCYSLNKTTAKETYNFLSSSATTTTAI